MSGPLHTATRLVGWVGGALAVAATVAAVLTRPFVPPRRTTDAPRSGADYDPRAAGRPVVSPFHLDTQPMRGLALFNFERDPDVVYKGLEPQAFDDDVHGSGLLVIGWRVDGRVDVFHDPGLRLDPATYAIAGGGLHRMATRDLSGGVVELGPSGATIDLAFGDLEGRPVRLVARETDTRTRRPFALLAPMGSAAADPPALPLVFVKDFYFVRRAGSEVRIEIDGRAHRSDSLPLVLDGSRMRFVRYSANPFVALWNHRDHDTAQVVSSSTTTATSDGTTYRLVDAGPFREIREMSCGEGRHRVAVEFDPPLPQLTALVEDARVDGSFRLTTEPPAGTVTGTWRVARRDGHVECEVVPSGGWTPGDAQPMARLLFRLIRMFRTWPATYRWSGTVELPDPGADIGDPPPLVSSWQRTDRPPATSLVAGAQRR